MPRDARILGSDLVEEAIDSGLVELVEIEKAGFLEALDVDRDGLDESVVVFVVVGAVVDGSLE